MALALVWETYVRWSHREAEPIGKQRNQGGREEQMGTEKQRYMWGRLCVHKSDKEGVAIPTSALDPGQLHF